MVAKKYKLYSASGESGSTAPCAFFASPAGCRNGDKCKFLHAVPDEAAASKGSSTGSFVSSESEGDVSVVPPIAPSPPALTSVDDKSIKKNKKKRKKVDVSDDIFASPKGAHVTYRVPTEQSRDKRRKATQKNTPNLAPEKLKLATSPPGIESPRDANSGSAAAMVAPLSHKEIQNQLSQKKSKQPVIDFRSLNLPITSFSIEGQATKTPPATIAVKAKVVQPLPLPEHTPAGRKWLDAVTKTREHVRYSGSFDFEKMKESDEEAGRGYATDWITARQFGSWCLENPQAIAIDCEMCETRDPVSGSIDSKALCRLSVINADNPEEVLLDTLVKPAWPVVDHRSRINGIKEEHLANVQFTLRHAQAFLMALCSNETVIIGHALHNDLGALKMEHHCIVDSSFLFPIKDTPNATPSLKDLALSVVKKEMPQTHDSVNDARIALLCLETYLAKKGNVSPIERSLSRNAIAATQLFVHRIPKMCQPSHLNNMFLTHTSVQPTEVDEIEFKTDTGRTHVTFRSSRHATLAFDTLEGKEEADASGRMQKKVYLKNGGYVRVRMMVRPRTVQRESTGGKSSDEN